MVQRRSEALNQDMDLVHAFDRRKCLTAALNLEFCVFILSQKFFQAFGRVGLFRHFRIKLLHPPALLILSK